MAVPVRTPRHLLPSRAVADELRRRPPGPGWRRAGIVLWFAVMTLAMAAVFAVVMLGLAWLVSAALGAVYLP